MKHQTSLVNNSFFELNTKNKLPVSLQYLLFLKQYNVGALSRKWDFH